MFAGDSGIHAPDRKRAASSISEKAIHAKTTLVDTRDPMNAHSLFRRKMVASPRASHM
jgi:hypothetical protein